jgi:hypothetical protein
LMLVDMGETLSSIVWVVPEPCMSNKPAEIIAGC